MSEDEIEIFLRIHGKLYEGRVRPQKMGSQVLGTRSPAFPEPYCEMLSITDQGSFWQIKPKTFLQTQDFAEIARIVKQYSGGHYISAGKASHFRVPKA